MLTIVSTTKGQLGILIALFIFAFSAAWLIRIWIHRTDPLTRLGRAKIPEPLDLYRIAYLRGGENELIRTIILRFIDLGAIEQSPYKIKGLFGTTITRGHVWQTIGNRIDTRPLSKLEQRVLDYFRKSPKAIKSIYKDIDRWSRVPLFEDYKNWGIDEHLLVNDNRRQIVQWGTTATIVVIESILIYILIFQSKSNTLQVFYTASIFLVPLIIFSLARLTRLTHRGKEWLSDLQSVYASKAVLKDTVLEEGKKPEELGVQVVPNGSGAAVLTYSLFGLTSIANSKYKDFAASAMLSPGGGCSSIGCGVGGISSSDCGPGCAGGGCSGGSCSSGGCGGGCGGD